MRDDLFNYLIATDELDEFLGYKLDEKVKNEIDELLDACNEEEIPNILKNISLKYNISYDILLDYYKNKQ